MAFRRELEQALCAGGKSRTGSERQHNRSSASPTQQCPDGRDSSFPEVFTFTRADTDIEVQRLVRAELLEVEGDDVRLIPPDPPKPSQRPVEWPKSSAPKQPAGKPSSTDRKAPRAKVPTRAGVDQAEHMRRLRWSKMLKETPQAHHLAPALHLQMRSKRGKRFSETPLTVSAVLLSELTGMSGRTVELLSGISRYWSRVGFYRRVDAAKGGYSGKASAAAWLSTLPEFE